MVRLVEKAPPDESREKHKSSLTRRWRRWIETLKKREIGAAPKKRSVPQ